MSINDFNGKVNSAVMSLIGKTAMSIVALAAVSLLGWAASQLSGLHDEISKSQLVLATVGDRLETLAQQHTDTLAAIKMFATRQREDEKSEADWHILMAAKLGLAPPNSISRDPVP